MGEASLLACDWGTSHLRAWTLDADGAVVAERAFELGVSRLSPGGAQAAFAKEVRPALGAEALPAILCGMVGSDLGWRLAPYLDCPAGVAEVAAALLRIESANPPAVIVPGLRCPGATGASDVMRGEETQIFGWLAADPDRRLGRRLLCHPGTHAKWVLIEGGRVMRFQTAMTGELFALLRAHGVLASNGLVDDEPAFDEGVRAAGHGEALLARLFSARGRLVADGRARQSAASYLSGLLIGADVAGTPSLLGAEGQSVELLGEPGLCRRYQRALAARGVAAALHDGGEAARAGLFLLWRMEAGHAAG